MRGMVVVVAGALIVAGACSSGRDGSSGAQGSSPAATSEPSQKAPVELSGTVNVHGEADLASKGQTAEIEIEADDFYFQPTFVKGAPGASVTVKLRNEGTAQHTFTIDSLSLDETLAPDARKDVTVTLPSTGTVNYYCRFHKGQGMQGAFYFS